MNLFSKFHNSMVFVWKIRTPMELSVFDWKKSVVILIWIGIFKIQKYSFNEKNNIFLESLIDLLQNTHGYFSQRLIVSKITFALFCDHFVEWHSCRFVSQLRMISKKKKFVFHVMACIRKQRYNLYPAGRWHCANHTIILTIH